jgi:hypothetical protein
MIWKNNFSLVILKLLFSKISSFITAESTLGAGMKDDLGTFNIILGLE